MGRGRSGPKAQGSARLNAKLTEAIVREARQRWRGGAGEPARVLAREFGVSGMAMSRALRGETWGHVE